MKSDYYLNFENRFRGDRHVIINQFSMYDKLIELILKNNESPTFLDIGCGRGEWLARWRHTVKDCYGIECDKNMIRICKNDDLDVIEGDALSELQRFPDCSVSLITIFHMIEHLEHDMIYQLMDECKRVLSKNGILLMETPSIDNLLVSSKLFYIDHTHINHINPDGISFLLENSGFHKIQYYYIHGGPLNNDNPLKVTRILNGVAQDLLIIATKSASMTEIIFDKNRKWEMDLDIGLSTLKAAEEYDLTHENLNELNKSMLAEYSLSMKNEIKNNMKNIEEELIFLKGNMHNIEEELIFLKGKLKYAIKLIDIFKTSFKPFVVLFNLCKKRMLLSSNKVLHYFFNHKLIRKILFSPRFLKIFEFILINFFTNFSTSKRIKILNKLKKLDYLNQESIKFNDDLLLHHKSSKRSRDLLRFFKSKF